MRSEHTLDMLAERRESWSDYVPDSPDYVPDVDWFDDWPEDAA